jgi:hypothetical protein
MRAFILGLLALCALPSMATAAPNLKKVLQARYDQLITAKAAGDNEAASRIFTPDFPRHEGNAIIGSNADRFISEVEALPDVRRSATVMGVRPSADGKAQEVIERYEMTGTRVLANGAAHPVDLVVDRLDTWVMLDGEWRMQATAKRRVNYSLDGKLVYTAMGNLP